MERKKKTSYNVLPSSIRSIHDKKLKENEEKSRNLLSFFLLHVISNVCVRAISVEISNKIRKIVSRISSTVRRDVDHKFIPSKSFPSHVKIFRPLLNVIGFFFRRDSLLGSVIFFLFFRGRGRSKHGNSELKENENFPSNFLKLTRRSDGASLRYAWMHPFLWEQPDFLNRGTRLSGDSLSSCHFFFFFFFTFFFPRKKGATFCNSFSLFLPFAGSSIFTDFTFANN